jgi:hypothetical protein
VGLAEKLCGIQGENYDDRKDGDDGDDYQELD